MVKAFRVEYFNYLLNFMPKMNTQGEAVRGDAEFWD